MVMGDMEIRCDLLVVGSGPDGCRAAFQAAQTGLDVVMVESFSKIGGSQLYDIQLPIMVANSFLLARRAYNEEEHNLNLTAELNTLQKQIDKRRTRVHDYLQAQAKTLSVVFLTGQVRFEDNNRIQLTGKGLSRIRFRNCVITTVDHAAYSVEASFKEEDGLQLFTSLPASLLIKSGETNNRAALAIASLYNQMGTQVSVSGLQENLAPDFDSDLAGKFLEVLIDNGIKLDFADALDHNFQKDDERSYETLIDLRSAHVVDGPSPFEKCGIALKDGLVAVDDQMRSSVPHIFAIGKAIDRNCTEGAARHQGKIAAEIICGRNSAYDVRAIPTIIRAIPALCWCGLTEQQAHNNGLATLADMHSWKSSFYSHIAGTEGFTKLILDADSGRILGGGAMGIGCESLLGEISLAIENGIIAEDLALTLHAFGSMAEASFSGIPPKTQ